MKAHILKRALIWPKLLLIGLALGVVVLGGWALARHGRNPAQAKAAPGVSEALPALPKPTGNSATDRDIAKWAEQARQHPNEDGVWVNLGDALMQKVRETADSSYYAYAERVFARALALNPQNAEAMTGLAWVNGGRHIFDKSIEWARKAIALEPRDYQAYGLIGDAQMALGDYNGAFESYQRMLDIHPDISSYSRGAYLLHVAGDNRKARWLMGKAIKAGAPYAENTAWCRVQLALILFSNANLIPAEQVLKDALAYAPNNYQVLAAMGKIKAAEKDYNAAIDYYKRAIAIVPLHDSLVALGDLYRLTGKPEEAEKQYALVEAVHKILKANGVRGDMQIAQFYADHDRNLPEALKLAEAEYVTNKNVYAADTLAWCYYKNGRYAQARDMIKAALSQHTPEASFLFHAGMIYAKLGNIPDAKIYLYRALSMNPNFSPIYGLVASDTLHKLGSIPPDAVKRVGYAGN
ncbi:MAG TPA: tetratricopeptide repeat protein [Chthonomonadaceae bacterium]|nr:tetratricopeptide repeat protein [Chthonomonadaceae bacterium]